MLVVFPFALNGILSSIQFLFKGLKGFVVLYFEYFFVEDLLFYLVDVSLGDEGDVVDADRL